MSCSRIAFLDFKLRMMKIISSSTTGAKKKKLLICICFDDDAGSIATRSILAKFLSMLIKKLHRVLQRIFESLVGPLLVFSSLVMILKVSISFVTFYKLV